MLQSLNHLCGLSQVSLWYVHVSLILVIPVLDPALQMCLTRAEERGRITSLDLLLMLCLTQPRVLLAFFLAVAASCSTWCPPGPPAPFLHVPVHGVVSPRGRTWHFPLSNSVRSLSAHFSSLARSLWTAGISFQQCSCVFPEL